MNSRRSSIGGGADERLDSAGAHRPQVARTKNHQVREDSSLTAISTLL
jgi:hypothetical protein